MWQSIRQIWQILSPLDRRKVFYVLILVIGMACVESVGVISIMPFLAVLSDPQIIETQSIIGNLYNFIGANSVKQAITYLGIISLFFVVGSAFFKMVTQYAVNRFASLQRHYFSTRLLKIYLEQNYEFFIQRNSSTLVKNILSEVDLLIWTLILPTLNVMSYSVVLFAMISILLVYDPIMALATASILGFFYTVIYWVIRKKLTKIGQEFSFSNQQRYHTCQEALAGIKDVIINDAKDTYIEQFESSSRVFARHIATRDTLGQIPLNIIETVGYGCLIGLAISLVLLDKDESHILPVLGLYGFAAYRMLPAAQNIYRGISQIKFSTQILGILQSEFELEKIEKNNKGREQLMFNRSIRLENIIFSYQNRNDQKILNNFNLEIPKNTSVGIMGKSGSGKSTLMDIMLGLLTPQQGKIYIDDVELSVNNVKNWRELVGYVPQFIYLADKTIAENIAFGVPKNNIDLEKVKRVAQLSQIDDFIVNNLKNGYQELIGEQGIMLSGGQRQRIGIARALYKNPQVLFMDEATSALDSETESVINDSIKSLNGKVTIVIIAHRSHVIESCDQMIYM